MLHHSICSLVWTKFVSPQWHLRIRRGKTLSEETWSWRRDVTLCRSSRGKSMSDWLLWRERSRRGRWWYWSLISILSAHCPIVIVPATFCLLTFVLIFPGAWASRAGEETTAWTGKAAGETERLWEAERGGETQRDREKRGKEKRKWLEDLHLNWVDVQLLQLCNFICCRQLRGLSLTPHHLLHLLALTLLQQVACCT